MDTNKWLIFWLGIFLLAFVVVMSRTGHAQTTHDEGHAMFHDVYQTWRIPGTDTSCCNARKTENGVTTGDCYPTEAELRSSAHPEIKHLVWWAKLDTGRWIEVPDNKILAHEINPDPTGHAAHLCEMNEAVLCFREPVGGM